MQYEIRKVDELSHHGISGQKWGIRRFQNKDGSLTDEGRKRYGYTGVGSFKESFPTFTKWGARAKEKAEEAKQDKHRRLVEYGSPKEIQKNLNKFSPSELKEIQSRFATELSVRDHIAKLSNNNSSVKSNDKDDARSSITKGTKFIQENFENLSKSVSSAKTFYNTVAVINNSLRKATPSSSTPGLHAGDNGYMHLIT